MYLRVGHFRPVPYWGIVRNMRISSCTSVSATFLALCLGSTGCNLLKGEEKPAPGASAANEVGRPLQDIELPVSLRISDPAPRDARQVEATDEQLRLDGDPVVAL